MNQKIGDIISEKRKQANLTQQDLADKLGVSNTAISKWENDINYPDISLIQPLCKILNIDVIKLLEIEEKPKTNKYKYITITLIIAIILSIVSLGFTYKKEPTYDVSKVSLDNKNYTIDGLIINKEQTNNLLIYNFKENKNDIGTTEEKDIKEITVIINNKNKYVFSRINDLINELNSTMISSKDPIDDIKIEITYIYKNKQEKINKIKLDIDDFE